MLSSSSKGEGWETGEEYSSSSEPSTFYDSKLSNNSSRSNGSVAINGLNKANGGIGSNGIQLESAVIRIDLPAPHRDEPKFPREYIKTLVGKTNTYTHFVHDSGGLLRSRWFPSSLNKISFFFDSFCVLLCQLVSDYHIPGTSPRTSARSEQVRPTA